MPDRVDIETVRHVADLARIHVTDQDLEPFAQQLSKILAYVEMLGELDTTGVEPMRHPVAPTDALRPDAPRDRWSSDTALAPAPDRHGDFIRVPKVLEQGDA